MWANAGWPLHRRTVGQIGVCHHPQGACLAAYLRDALVVGGHHYRIQSLGLASLQRRDSGSLDRRAYSSDLEGAEGPVWLHPTARAAPMHVHIAGPAAIPVRSRVWAASTD